MAEFTQEEMRFIRENLGKITDTEIARKVGCGRATISHYRNFLHIDTCPYRKLSEEDREFIINHYRIDMSTKELAEHFGVRQTAIRYHVQKLGITNDQTRNKKR